MSSTGSRPGGLRQAIYIDPEIQFPLIVALILFVTFQGLFVGWGFAKALAIAGQWQRPDQARDFFAVLLATIIPVVLLNFAAGSYFSHKIAGPLRNIRGALAEVARGNLESRVAIRQGDLLQSFALDCNRMIESLRRLIYRDRLFAQEVDDLLTQCRGWLESQPLDSREREKMQKLISEAKNRLSVINAHFMKGQTGPT